MMMKGRLGTRDWERPGGEGGVACAWWGCFFFFFSGELECWYCEIPDRRFVIPTSSFGKMSCFHGTP